MTPITIETHPPEGPKTHVFNENDTHLAQNIFDFFSIHQDENPTFAHNDREDTQ